MYISSAMTKVLKRFIISAYVILFIRYLTRSLNFNDDVELDYVIPSFKGVPKTRRHFVNTNRTVTTLGFKRQIRFPSDYKYILLKAYTKELRISTDYNTGQKNFIDNKCKYINCYFSNDIDLLLDIRQYDAILFHVEDIFRWDDYIKLRDPQQKYIFFASQSSAKFPMIDEDYNDRYNLTWTYKLDSDIIQNYFTIFDKSGKVVGPRINMNWKDRMIPVPKKLRIKLRSKTKAVAWFVPNCNNDNNLKLIANAIGEGLKKYKLTIDTYGWCGGTPCPEDKFKNCLSLLETDYFFYLAFENAVSEDYVTNEVLYPLLYYSVPIVYGGANYSRFLPPGSYIDAKQLNATQVVYEIYKAIRNRKIYADYFRWRRYYKYSQNKPLDVCKLCQVLNEQADNRSSHKNFVHWWNDQNRTNTTNPSTTDVIPETHFKNEDGWKGYTLKK